MQGPLRECGSAGVKNVLDALENDTKANFQENNTCKVRFRKSRRGGGYALFTLPFLPVPSEAGQGASDVNKKRSEVR